jgi:hypothetical protein
MNQTEHLVVKRHELVKVANAMLAGDMNLIEGIRQICSLRFAVADPENEVFLAIRGIESETDTFPIGQMRSNYSQEYLQRMDFEMQSYLAEAKDDIRQACQEIVQTFS